MAVLDEVKLMLDITDVDMDEKLGLIIANSQKKLLTYLPSGTIEVPDALSYIVTELSVTRFNRIGNEGMTAYSQEGESITFDSDDMAPYLSAINAYNAAQTDATSGVVRFL
jgi:hypothetical protein